MVPQGCPAGSYHDEIGQDNCKACPAGECRFSIYLQGRIEHPRLPDISGLVWGWILQFFQHFRPNLF